MPAGVYGGGDDILSMVLTYGPGTTSKNDAQIRGSGCGRRRRVPALHDAAELDLSDHAAAPA
jgi:hypothetical protein